MNSPKSLLLVANYDSAVGYAWWLMESFWVKLAEYYHQDLRVFLAFPSISTISSIISVAPLEIVEQDFNKTKLINVLFQCRFLRRCNICAIYFSDKPTWHWRYALYRIFGVRLIIVHDHTPGLRASVSGFKALFKRIIHRIPCLSADGAIGASEFIRQRLININRLPSKRCFAAPNGLPNNNPVRKSEDLHRLFQIPVDNKIIVMTGRAHSYKRVDFILQCLAKLIKDGKRNFHFIFIGDGPDLENFISTAGILGVADFCTFTRYRNNILALLENADFAIHPSKGEVGYSLSILEYMQAGLPVIVPDNPSVCGATEHEFNGLIYPEGDIQIAASMIERLLKDSAYRIWLGENARIIAQEYSLEKTHLALIEAFRKIDHKGVLAAF